MTYSTADQQYIKIHQPAFKYSQDIFIELSYISWIQKFFMTTWPEFETSPLKITPSPKFTLGWPLVAKGRPHRCFSIVDICIGNFVSVWDLQVTDLLLICLGFSCYKKLHLFLLHLIDFFLPLPGADQNQAAHQQFSPTSWDCSVDSFPSPCFPPISTSHLQLLSSNTSSLWKHNLYCTSESESC